MPDSLEESEAKEKQRKDLDIMSQELIIINQSLPIGQIANQYAAQNAFSNYQQRLATNTLRRQQADLDVFASYLAQAGEVREGLMINPQMWEGITHGLVEGFVEWMLQQGYAIGTVNLKLSTIKVYCKLALKAGVISSEECGQINMVTGYRHAHGRNVDQKREVTRIGDKKAVAVSISPAQARQLKTQPDTPQGRRDAFLMCLLLDHGLRCGEVAALAPDSLNLSTGTLTFYRQKVDKTQTHQLTRDTLLAAIRYLEICKPKTKLLMGSRKGGKLEGEMSERAITDRVKTLGEAIGITGLSAHDCRHYWATSAVRNGTDIKSLQDAGGWSSPAMPLRYAESASIANKGVKLD
jgi:integrase